MIARRAKMCCAGPLALLLLNLPASGQPAQVPADESPQSSVSVSSLDLGQSESANLQHAIDTRDYLTAEKLLLAEIDRDAHSKRTARLLDYAGSVYFLNHDYLHAAVAWKKSEVIEPLDPKLQFSLAMAYIQISKPDWARPVLKSLATSDHKEALYPYWLGRLDYDGHEYDDAIRNFKLAIELNPQMARAYDNLGLCYYYENQNDLAIENYKKAIQLDRESVHPSPWPYLNLGITLQFLNRFTEAEENFREAIRLNPEFTQAHFQLGLVLEEMQRFDASIEELRRAASLDAQYPEPHMAMARVYRRLGQEAAAREEVQIYLRLHPRSTP
jgi:tetratricopeptide (TPR) repeat protein